MLHAPRRPGVYPQRTLVHSARRGWRAQRRRGTRLGHPVGQRWTAHTQPPVIVVRAQTLCLAPEPATPHRAWLQRGVAVKRRVGGGRELRQLRAALCPPPGRVPGAQPPLPARAHTAVHRALRCAEHRIPRVEDQDLSAKRRPECGHQLLQQPGRAPYRQATSARAAAVDGDAGPGRSWPPSGLPTTAPAHRTPAFDTRLDTVGGAGRTGPLPAYHDSSLPANQPAASSAARASSTVR